MIDWSAFFMVLLCLLIEYAIPIIAIVIVLTILITCGYLIYDKKFNKDIDDEEIEEVEEIKTISNED